MMHGSSLKDVVLDDSVEDDDVEESLEVDVLYLFTNILILMMTRNPQMTLTMLLMVRLMVKMSLR